MFHDYFELLRAALIPVDEETDKKIENYFAFKKQSKGQLDGIKRQCSANKLPIPLKYWQGTQWKLTDKEMARRKYFSCPHCNMEQKDAAYSFCMLLSNKYIYVNIVINSSYPQAMETVELVVAFN